MITNKKNKMTQKAHMVIVLSVILMMLIGTTVYAGTSYSKEATVTVGKFGFVCPTHPVEQTKVTTGQEGQIKVSSVGGDYQIYVRMTTKGPQSYYTDHGKQITISTGDIKLIPSKSTHNKGDNMLCLFSTSFTTYVDVECTSQWKSN